MLFSLIMHAVVLFLSLNQQFFRKTANQISICDPLLQDFTRLKSLTMHGEVTEATALLPSLITEGRDARKPLVVEFLRNVETDCTDYVPMSLTCTTSLNRIF